MLTRTLHSTDANVSNLFTHFEVLENFRTHQLQLQQQQSQNPPITMDISSQLHANNEQNQIIQKTPSSINTVETNNNKNVT